MKELGPLQGHARIAPVLPLREVDLKGVFGARLLVLPVRGRLEVLPVRRADAVGSGQGAPGGFLVGKEAVLDDRGQFDPDTLVESRRARGLQLHPGRPVVGERVDRRLVEVPVDTGVREIAVVELHAKPVVAGPDVGAHLPCRGDPGYGEAAGALHSPAGRLAIELTASVDAEHPQVPPVLDLGARDHALARHVPWSDAHQAHDVAKSGTGGEARQTDAQRVGEPVQLFALGVGGGRLVPDRGLVALVGAGAEVVEAKLPAPAAGAQAGDDDVHVGRGGIAHPVHPVDLGAVVVEVAPGA